MSLWMNAQGTDGIHCFWNLLMHSCLRDKLQRSLGVHEVNSNQTCTMKIVVVGDTVHGPRCG